MVFMTEGPLLPGVVDGGRSIILLYMGLFLTRDGLLPARHLFLHLCILIVPSDNVLCATGGSRSRGFVLFVLIVVLLNPTSFLLVSKEILHIVKSDERLPISGDYERYRPLLLARTSFFL